MHTLCALSFGAIPVQGKRRSFVFMGVDTSGKDYIRVFQTNLSDSIPPDDASELAGNLIRDAYNVIPYRVAEILHEFTMEDLQNLRPEDFSKYKLSGVYYKEEK